jgi:hypothetical protein
VQHILELILNCRTITTIHWMAPGNNRSTGQERSKSKSRGLNLLRILELLLNSRTVTTKLWIALGHY